MIRRIVGIGFGDGEALGIAHAATIRRACGGNQRLAFPARAGVVSGQDTDAMPDASLRDFMTRLENAGDLVRVKEPVSTVLEMTEIQTRLLAEGGPAVLFERPVRVDGEPSEMPVLVNLFGTIERVARGMDREPQDLRALGETLAFLRQPAPPGGVREALDMMPLAKSVLAMAPKTVKRAPCQEIVHRG